MTNRPPTVDGHERTPVAGVRYTMITTEVVSRIIAAKCSPSRARRQPN
jgi:hypothetical protein